MHCSGFNDAFMFKQNQSFSFIIIFINTFFLPLFFFISGFFAYKSNKFIFRDLINNISKKFKRLIIGCLIFWTLFVYVFLNNNFETGIVTNYYWFCISLFEMFLIYYIFKYIVNNANECVKNISLIFSSLVLFAAYLLIVRLEERPFWMRVLLLEELGYYYIYFVLGIFVRKYYSKIIKIISNRYVSSIILIGFLLPQILLYNNNFQSSLITGMWICVKFAGVLSILIFFHSLKDFFDRNGIISKALTYIGVSTLEIYYLHYYFIPDLWFMKGFLPVESGYIPTGNASTLMITFLCFFSILVIILSLLTSRLLKSSEFFREILFGKFTKINKSNV